jgi:hypothetical protein
MILKKCKFIIGKASYACLPPLDFTACLPRGFMLQGFARLRFGISPHVLLMQGYDEL